MAYVLIRAWLNRQHSPAGAFALAWPSFSVQSLNTFTKMALFALSCFEMCAITSDECRNPEKDVSRSVWIAAPVIAVMYILGTAAILAYVAPADVDLAAPVAQVTRVAFGAHGLGATLTAIAVVIAIVAVVGGVVTAVGLVSRLPMVAGWDNLLPGWWSELHPRFRTPSKAIGAVSASLLSVCVLSLLGAGNQEAVQVAMAAGFGSYCIMYMLLFGAVLLGFRSGVWRPGLGVRMGALAAFSVAAVSFVFELAPLGEVKDTASFALKVGGMICAGNALGACLYWRGSRGMERMAAVSGK
jgi:amino acid transporter